MHLHPVSSLLALLTLSAGAAQAAKPRDAILLSQVESLTLRGDKQTTHRRVSAIPQLKCISNRDICAKHAIDLMRCENKGSGYDSEDIQWSCTAQLPPELKLGSTDVICEGYSSPDDPYVLKGSCGVEYRMVLTRAGEDKWPDLGGGGSSMPSADSVFPILFWIIFVAVLGYIVVSACRATPNDPARPRAPRRFNNNNNGGGGGDGWDDPPPPYPGTGSGRGGGWGRKNNGLGGSAEGNSNWQSNLMSGAAGAAAGYYAGSRGRNNNTNNAAPNYGSTWGGGGGAGPSRSGSSGSSSGSAASTSRHESTGFGSTSRR
ncbi:hypothetical protein N0V93_005239 [Gnomoniopsis smithogilvyi]|uniref:Store-operated calcium entry-associated regulatory factor n=1 Tax=Gnomoniopsis smithogilvyi TaxID=1191159 RepID=A0A9W8YU81_9PEZI|nr:hypothetical protein N0V93_005239 [Gnomoniopsis smithogilvyi]